MTTKTFRHRVLDQEILSGTFLGIGSSVTAEIAALSGFDWLLIDTEHGIGEHELLVPQLQAIAHTGVEPIVRIAFNDLVRIKRVLDLGARGIMVPWVKNAEEAREAVSALRYPPAGIRGAARITRATGYGNQFGDYFESANSELVTVIQIECREAIEAVEEIAAIDGVDVLFIGPLDLSISLGIPQQFDHPDFHEAVDRVLAASRNAGKSAGILIMDPNQLSKTADDGFRFIALGSDAGVLSNGLRALASAFDDVRI
jgi:4-hydroxy-2-oxoheptanedioate aldolase